MQLRCHRRSDGLSRKKFASPLSEWVIVPLHWRRASNCTGTRGAQDTVPGLMNVEFGGYHVGDIEVSTAFDVDALKVGQESRRRSSPRPTTRSSSPSCTPPAAVVEGRPTIDGTRSTSGNRSGIKRNRWPNVPASCGGRQRTSPCYSCRSARSGRPVVRRTRPGGRGPRSSMHPRLHSSSGHWRRRFEERRLPMIGDDIKSQWGLHSCTAYWTNLLRERGVRLDRTIR